MDQDEELARLKQLLFMAVVFLIAAWYSWSELRYAVWGGTAPGEVVAAYETRSMGRRGRGRAVLAVEYRFVEADGTHRKGRDDVPLDWDLPRDGRIVVQYLAGEGRPSRLEGRRNTTAVVIFLGCLGMLSVVGYRFCREVKDAVDGPPRRRGRSR